jgi:tetratricopeptide (TPR) repeat protein
LGRRFPGQPRRDESKSQEAIAFLEQAIQFEDNLQPDEPPDWLQPSRHTLGAILLKAGDYSRAEKVYQEDLQRNPENGWALFGLAQALKGLGRDGEAKSVKTRFQKSWRSADVQLKATCLCLQ